MTANMNIFRNSNDTIKLFYFAQFFLLLLSTFSATAEEYASLPRLSSHFEQRFRPPEGSTFLLKCPFESIASVEWELNGKPLNRQKSSAVDFPTISRTDSGIYRCTIRSHFGVVFSPALNVTVLCKFCWYFFSLFFPLFYKKLALKAGSTNVLLIVIFLVIMSLI